MGLLSKVGGALNSLTGVSSAAAQSQKYAMKNAWMNHAMQKEFAQNAHQWEMQDLQKAGLNPALTATGGSGASASGGGSFGGNTGSPAGNPFDILNGLVGIHNQTSATNADNKLKAAETMRIIEMLPLDKQEKTAIIKNLGLTGENIKTQTKYQKEQTVKTQGGALTGIFGTGSFIGNR